MKTISRIFIVTIFVAINACSVQSKRDLLVIEYERSNIEPSNQIEIVFSEDVGFITGQDSLNYYFNRYKHAYPSTFDSVDSFISYHENSLANTTRLIKEYTNKIKMSEASNKSPFFYEDMISKLEDTLIKRQFELNNLLAFSRRNDEVFFKKVKYTVVTDEPNKIEVTSLYFFTLDETEIIGKIYLFERTPKKSTLFNFY